MLHLDNFINLSANLNKFHWTSLQVLKSSRPHWIINEVSRIMLEINYYFSIWPYIVVQINKNIFSLYSTRSRFVACRSSSTALHCCFISVFLTINMCVYFAETLQTSTFLLAYTELSFFLKLIFPISSVFILVDWYCDDLTLLYFSTILAIRSHLLKSARVCFTWMV